MEILNIFDDKFHTLVKEQVKTVLLDSETAEIDVKEQPTGEKPNTLTCSYCRIQFDNQSQQREHYKLDWHRYNLKQSLLQKEPITEEKFTEKTTTDDISSISGSDSEKESLDTYATAQGKIFLQNASGKVFSVYTCLLCEKKTEVPDSIGPVLLGRCHSNPKWAVLMLGGGHFAAALFDKTTPILHKTFHCYTVRAGQGGAQASRDGRSGGSHPKSAGASLRRYNEQALGQHVKAIVEAWRKDLDACSLVFYRAAGPHNRSVLFAGPAPLLNKSDARIRSIPFSTRRATFAEVKRVHGLLSQAFVYGGLDAAVDVLEKKKEEMGRRMKVRVKNVNRARSRDMVDRSLALNVEESSSGSEPELSTELKEVSFEGLQQFEDTLAEERKRRRKPKKSKAQKLKEKESQRKKDLVELLCKGHVLKLGEMLENGESFVNEVLDDDENCALHIAAMNEQQETVRFLLSNGANPCVRNARQQTAYTCTQSKGIRETLRQFARDFPDRFNYNKAQIPTSALTPEELSERKRAQRKAKKEKEKAKRRENELKRKEEEQKERFLRLSDREKRALAAERRILDQSGAVMARCFLCAADITGKVPFEYLGNRFCSVDCLKAHRMQHPVVLS